MRPLSKWLEAFRGAGESAVTTPSMDGSLRPNGLLDQADVLFDGGVDRISSIATDGRRRFLARGHVLLGLDDGPEGGVASLAQGEGPICAVAVHPSGLLAIGVSGKGVSIHSPDGNVTALSTASAPFNCPVALIFDGADTLIVANGSARNAPEHWRRNLMEKNSSGSVWRVDLKGGAAKCVAKDLAYPCGVAVTESGHLVICEAWRHRLLRLGPEGKPSTLLDDLPGYPGAITTGDAGGYWLAVFAPRRQLVEFVLREDGYRKQMLETLDERHWIAPALKTGLDYFEPVQSGGVRHLGMIKPWACTRSYGLIVGLDAGFNPRSSYHSRAGANRHGITSVVEWRDRVLAVCSATNQLLAIDPNLTED